MQNPVSTPRPTRRRLLHGSLALLALREALAAEVPGGDDVDPFLAEWADRTARFLENDAPNEDAIVHQLSAALAERDPGSFPPRMVDSYSADGLTSGPVFADSGFLVVQLDLEPGAVIQPHNHVGYAFVSLGVRGESLVRHFEHSDDAPAPDELNVPFPVREVQSQVLAPGRSSSLTRTRANIHGFQAGRDGATILDFGFHFPGPGDGPKHFSALEIEEKAAGALERSYEACWIGNPFKEVERR